MNEGQESAGRSEAEGSSSALDHALLESLFYNEMMMLDPSSPGSSSFLSQHFSEATHPRQQQPQQVNVPPVVTTGDVNAIAESEMLRDFGVSSSPLRSSSQRHRQAQPAQPAAQTWTGPPAANPQHASFPSYAHLPPPPQHMNNVHTYGQPTHAGAPMYAAPPQPTHNGYHHGASKPMPVASPAARPPLSINTNLAAAPSNDRAKQLVDQFATLAARLGIELPRNVLQSLTASAAKNDPLLNSSAPNSATASIPQPVATGSSESSIPTLTDAEDPESGPLLELRKTAEEAIASVTKKRTPDDNEEDNDKDGKQPAAGKRKKKPRLADCESRLAELRAENELLKRHLENVSNKAHRFDQEKEAAGKRIHALLEHEAGPDEMNRAVGEFSEMYSDYGRNRQQELSFHLEQLQR